MELKYVTTRAPTTHLCHYASKYYDPVKAHEYYEKNKQLSGKKSAPISTSTLNDTGREASGYVKTKIDEERDEKIKEKQGEYEKELKKLRGSHNQYVKEKTKVLSGKISSLSSKYSKLNVAQRRILGPKLRMELNKLRAQNADDIKKLNKELDKKKETLQNKHNESINSLKEEYANKYNDELSNISKDSSMVKQTKVKTSTSKTSNKSTTKKSSKEKKSVEEQIKERFADWNAKKNK